MAESIEDLNVLVAMSGGVDSAVAAYLLKRQGYKVAGAFMINWSDPYMEDCNVEQELRDMRRVCKRIGIPAFTFNFEREYEKSVLEPFFQGYASGETPNPDILCNKEIKFKKFLERAHQMGISYIATGHYACITKAKDEHNGLSYHLLAGTDPEKDQSYFLYALSQQQLQHILFPVGSLQKSEVRRIAKEAQLHVADKKDSQGICFIGKVKLRKFLSERIEEFKGPVITTEGETIGTHQGLAFYTIGQRQGIGIAAGRPYYVVEKNMATNTLTVALGPANKQLYHKGLTVANVHWVNQAPRLPFRCQTRIRYRQKLMEATLNQVSHQPMLVHFRDPQRAITPGQAIVFYQNDEVLGGGTITQAL